MRQYSDASFFICSPNGNRLRSLTPSALFFSISYNSAKNCKNILEKVANLKGKYYFCK